MKTAPPKSILVFFIAVLALLSNTKYSFAVGENCLALARHGLQEIRSSVGETKFMVEMQRLLCRNTFKSSSKKVRAKMKAAYGLLSGQASFSQERMASFRKSFCKTARLSKRSESTERVHVKSFSALALEAWVKCLELSQKNVIVKMSKAGNHLAVGIKYVGPGQNVRVTGISSYPEGSITCQGRLRNNRGVIGKSKTLGANTTQELTANSWGISCHRKVKNGEAPAARLVLNSDMGQFIVPFAKITKERKPKALCKKASTSRSKVFTAVSMGRIRVVECLLQQGLDPNFQIDNQGNVLSSLAAERCNPAMIELLVRYGAKTNVKNKYRESAQDIGRSRCHPSRNRSMSFPLFFVIMAALSK